MWYALFDFQYSKEELLTNSYHYKIGLKCKCFGTKIFWYWFAYGAFTAAVLFFVTFYSFDITFHTDGRASGLWAAGSVTYAGVVIVTNMKIMEYYNNYNLIGVGVCVLSILLYFFFFFVESLSSMKINDLIGVFPKVMSHPICYFALIFCISQVWSVDKMFTEARKVVDHWL
jgi:magnesium-transporting ATPase (P-type)